MNELLLGLLNLPPEASSMARAIDTLHYFVIGSTMAGATLVFVMALVYTIRYRRKTPADLTPHLTASTGGETFIIASTLGLFLLFWVVGQYQYAQLMTPPDDSMPVYVMGKQWMWKFSYSDGRSTIDDLYVPSGRPVKLIMTSRDVIHSFYVPEFRVKHDVVPGRYYTAWFTATREGVYTINCAEYCGVNHSRMLGRVHVMSPADYAAWLEGRKSLPKDESAGDLAAEGRDVATKRACLACHTVDGQKHIAPTWAGLYMSKVPLSDGSTVVADEAYLTRSMMDPNAEIVEGFKGVMPTYRGVLTEPEAAALVEFIKSLRDKPIPPSVQLPPVVPEGSGVPLGVTR